MATKLRTRFKNPDLFKAPGGLSFERHVRLHAAEKLRYFEELDSLTEDQRNLRNVDPRYVEAMRRRWVTMYMGEIASAQYMGTAAANAPIEMWEFVTACVCQQMDELHHAEMDRDLLRRIGLSQMAWEAIYDDTAAKIVFDHLLSLDDPFEIAVKGGVFLESASAVVAFPALIRIAEAHGDYLTAANHRTRLTDEPRHMALGVATMKALLADDPDNVHVLQQWQDEFAAVLPNILDASREMTDLPKGGFSRDRMWAAMVEHHVHTAEKYGLRPSLSV